MIEGNKSFSFQASDPLRPALAVHAYVQGYHVPVHVCTCTAWESISKGVGGYKCLYACMHACPPPLTYMYIHTSLD